MVTGVVSHSELCTLKLLITEKFNNVLNKDSDFIKFVVIVLPQPVT